MTSHRAGSAGLIPAVLLHVTKVCDEQVKRARQCDSVSKLQDRCDRSYVITNVMRAVHAFSLVGSFVLRLRDLPPTFVVFRTKLSWWLMRSPLNRWLRWVLGRSC